MYHVLLAYPRMVPSLVRFFVNYTASSAEYRSSIHRQLTGNDTYRNLTEKSVRHIISLEDPLPGLAAQCIDPSTGEFDCGYVVSFFCLFSQKLSSGI